MTHRPSNSARRSFHIHLTALALVLFAVHPEPAAAIGGIEGTFEYAIDAPWRIEPFYETKGSAPSYGAVPILVSIHDAMDVTADPVFRLPHIPHIYDLSSLLSLGNFCSLTVTDADAPDEPRIYSFADLAEVEATSGNWVWPPPSSGQPPHQLCKRWQNENCSDLRDLSATSEWHALLFHEMQPPPAAGDTRDLVLEVRLTRFPEVSCESAASDTAVPSVLTLRNHVRIHFAKDPLPRFGDGWLYGDLHYHSQGTDNEGESAYSYRGVVRAMGAMGLDFALAAEHASNSEQIVDADVSVGPNLFEWEAYFESTQRDTLRDMSRARFASHHALIHDPGGVNDEAAIAGGPRLPQGVLSQGVVPQLLLGGELDVIPEVAIGEAGARIPWGKGLEYDVHYRLCRPWSAVWSDCDEARQWQTAAGGVMIRDVQGINDYDYGREHLVYLPGTAALELPDQDEPQPQCVSCPVCAPESCKDCGPPDTCIELPAPPAETYFISGDTGEYGGASRRLAHGSAAMLPELEQKGHAFLAHPLNSPNGTRGPDGPPWSEHMFEQAWRSPAILGLQLWNEDSRRHSNVKWRRPEGDDTFENGYQRDEGYEAPKPTDGVREGFLSESGEFELTPWGADGRWDEYTRGVETKLGHGTFAWDEINHKGLDPAKTSELDWLDGLAPDWLEGLAPRRMWMAGGSDAHGDLNYSRKGYFLGAERVTDTAMGTPRNLVDVGAEAATRVPVDNLPEERWPAKYDHAAVLEALESGRFTVTDGPALRIAVDRNNDGVVDDGDVPMGGIAEIDARSEVTLLVQWQSTVEFGAVEWIDLYLGVHNASQGRTYAPYRHGTGYGMYSSWLDRMPSGVSYVDAEHGREHVLLNDGYWHIEETPGTRLRISGGPGGPDLPLCDAETVTCTHVGETTWDPLPRMLGNDCYTENQEILCDLCGLEGVTSCTPNGSSLPVPDLPLPDDVYTTRTEAVTLDLSAFEAAEGVPGKTFFVRAFARTHYDRRPEGRCDNLFGDCIRRYAFTNPIWLLPSGGVGDPPNVPEPRLIVTLNVVSPPDAGRFNLHVDGVPGAYNVTDGASTGILTVAPGGHTVSQTAGVGTELSNYETSIGGDCHPSGYITLGLGDTKICTVTNTAQGCQHDCSVNYDLCMAYLDLDANDCVPLFNICMADCN